MLSLRAQPSEAAVNSAGFAYLPWTPNQAGTWTITATGGGATIDTSSIAVAAVRRSHKTRTVAKAQLRPIKNALVCGDELLDAVSFLSDALHLPALKPAPLSEDETITARLAVVLPFVTPR